MDCGGQQHYSRAIGRGCSGEVCNGVNGLLIKHLILRVYGVCRSVLLACGVSVFLLPFVVAFGHEGLERGPGLGVCWFPAPVTEVVVEDTCAEGKVVRNVECLLGSVRRACVGGVVRVVLYLFDEHLERHVGVRRGFHALIVLLKVDGGDLSVRGVEVLKEFPKGAVSVSNLGLGGRLEVDLFDYVDKEAL